MALPRAPPVPKSKPRPSAPSQPKAKRVKRRAHAAVAAALPRIAHTGQLARIDHIHKRLSALRPGGTLRVTAASRNPVGWTTVGDIGYLDADGYLYLTDRKADMIISGGVNVYPQEAENVLIGHPAVEDVAVFGIPNVDLGEEVKGVVQLRAGFSATEEELIAFCHERLAKYKSPRTIDFADELPRHARVHRRGDPTHHHGPDGAGQDERRLHRGRRPVLALRRPDLDPGVHVHLPLVSCTG
jgi:acyl-CoA synthetase (AMP-forming)/AMP-acid ligase II